LDIKPESSSQSDGALGAEAGELEGMADIAEAELFGPFFQRRDEAFVQADGGAAFPADNVVMVVAGLLGKIEGFSGENDPLDQARLPQRFQDAVDRGPVTDLRTHLGESVRGKGERLPFPGSEEPPGSNPGCSDLQQTVQVALPFIVGEIHLHRCH